VNPIYVGPWRVDPVVRDGVAATLPVPVAALARAIVGTRWGCADDTTRAHSQRAFAALHKIFPNTRWARQTKYYYGRQ